MIEEREVSATCPYCGSPISFVIDPFSGSQSYVEDCEVCCKPIQVSYSEGEDDDSDTLNFSVRRIDE